MAHHTKTDQHLQKPETVRGPDGTRADGRPTAPIGSPERPPSADHAPTEAPEERGETPSTENAPGGDL